MTESTYFEPPRSLTSPGSRLPVSAPQQGELVPQTIKGRQERLVHIMLPPTGVLKNARRLTWTCGPGRPADVNVILRKVGQQIRDKLSSYSEATS